MSRITPQDRDEIVAELRPRIDRFAARFGVGPKSIIRIIAASRRDRKVQP